MHVLLLGHVNNLLSVCSRKCFSTSLIQIMALSSFLDDYIGDSSDWVSLFARPFFTRLFSCLTCLLRSAWMSSRLTASLILSEWFRCMRADSANIRQPLPQFEELPIAYLLMECLNEKGNDISHSSRWHFDKTQTAFVIRVNFRFRADFLSRTSAHIVRRSSALDGVASRVQLVWQPVCITLYCTVRAGILSTNCTMSGRY